MSGRPWVFGVASAFLVALWAASGHSQQAAPASSEPGPPPVIWYRSSAGCPDGPAFLQRLHGRAEGARLAQVNDRIDFVVTLGSENGHSSGRLERQTTGSTVAMREIETASCDEAADVLALTLTLALDPTSSGGSASEASNSPETKQELLPATAVPSASAATSRSTPASASKDTAPNAGESPPRSKSSALLLGAEIGAATGPTERWGPFGGLFAELEAGNGFTLPGASARLAVVGFHVEDNAPGVAFTTIAGRLDGCPIDFIGTAVRVRPCLGVELGGAFAEGRSSSGDDDQGFWGAALASGRLTWVTSSAVALGLEVGAYVPFIRYTISSTANEVHQADPIGFFGGLDAAWRAP